MKGGKKHIKMKMRKARTEKAKEFRERYLDDDEQRLLMVLDCYGNAVARHMDQNDCRN